MLALALLSCSLQSTAPPELVESARRLEVTGGTARVSNAEDPKWEIWFDLEGKIKSKDLRCLQKVKRLAAVRILSDDLSDKLVADIRDNPDLKLLVIMSSKLTDKCTEPVSHMAGLTKLDLNKATLTKLGLAKLARLKKLERLYLYNATIPDRDLEPLKGLTWLKLLDLPPSTSEATLRAIRSALPMTVVECRKD